MTQKNNFKISFQERAQMARELLSKQPKVSLQEAKEQVRQLKENSQSKNKKGHG